MKTQIQLTLFALLLSIPALSQTFGTVKIPRPTSPPTSLIETIGLSTIKITYNRPSVTSIKSGIDRSGKIWGDFVPYGMTKSGFNGPRDIPWQAGDDENTTIEFSHDVEIEGNRLKAGQYGLHVIIHETNEATIIFSHNATSWGSFHYDPDEDALRAKVKMETIPHKEVLTFDFVRFGKDSDILDYGILALDWETKRIPFKVKFDVHQITLDLIRQKELRGGKAFGPYGYESAAEYCADHNINHVEGLVWINKAISTLSRLNSNLLTYGALSTKYTLLNQQGRLEESIAVIEEQSKIANANQINGLGYKLLTMKEFDKAIALFKQNVENHPDNAGVHDSLGEAYKQKGMKEEAIKEFRKALSLNPSQRIKENSTKLLKELGVDIKGNQ